jgi:pentatricopeptide repeat protein
MLKKRSIKSSGEAGEGGDTPKKIDFEARVERAKAVSLNKEIAKFARQKDLTSAKESFQTALTNGGTNSHTFSAIINAHVRCGDIVGAKAMYALLKKTKNVRIDVVSCTTLMKGFGSVGDLDSCDDIMRDMLKANPPIAPNIRTINTYLRGCLWCGGIQSGERMFARMQSEFHITPDISSWEYIVAMLCQTLSLDKALPMIGRLKGDASVSGGVGAMCINLARAAALLGELKICRKALKQAVDCLNTDEELQMAAETGDGEASEEEESGSDDDGAAKGALKQARPTLGGKQAWKVEENDARAQSLEVRVYFVKCVVSPIIEVCCLVIDVFE